MHTSVEIVCSSTLNDRTSIMHPSVEGGPRSVDRDASNKIIDIYGW